MAKIDDVDLSIIKELTKDSRQSFRDIAEKLSVSEGTVYNRVNKLREQKIIKSFMVDIDYAQLGYDLTAVVGIRAKGGRLQEIERKIANEKNVSAVYDVTGEYDALIVAKFTDREELNKLVKKLTSMEDVERTYTMMVLNVIKEAHGINLER